MYFFHDCDLSTFIGLKHLFIYFSLLGKGSYSPLWGLGSFFHERDIAKKLTSTRQGFGFSNAFQTKINFNEE